MELIRDISVNIILLFGLVFIVTLPGARFDLKKPLINGLIGVLIGGITVVIMMNAWTLSTGAIFDTRSVMIGVTALFFPHLTAVVATVIAMAYRLYVGGVGVYAGILSLLLALIIGLIWKRYIIHRLKINRLSQFYLFGLLVHLFVIMAQLAFPYPLNITVIRLLGPVMILAFPIATALLSIALLNHQNRLDQQKLLSASEKKYRTLIDTSKLGIFHYNTFGVIELANQAFADILKTTTKQLKGLDMKTLPNTDIVAGVNDSIKGLKSRYEGPYQSILSGHEVPVRVQFSPIYEENRVIGGIGIVEDLTEELSQKQNIDQLKKKDLLTGLNNRMSFDEQFFKDESLFVYPVTVIIFDINAFQIFNTTLGYSVGNEILKTVAQTIETVTDVYPEVDVYRTGGDEFSLISEGLDKQTIQTIIQSIKHASESLEYHNLDLKMSYGYAVSDNRTKPLTETFNKAVIKLHENKVYEGSSISKKTVDIIMSTLFEKSPREKMHSERVSQIAGQIARQFDPNPEFVNRVKLAARLHDIGKINISETILDKPDLLTNQEYEQIKKHPVSGFKILSSVPEYAHIANIVYTHHERFDGLGYPKGIKGDEIPLEARIIAVVDAYDAMTEQRTYRKVLTKVEALIEIQTHMGSQFDPQVANKFIEQMKQTLQN